MKQLDSEEYAVLAAHWLNKIVEASLSGPNMKELEKAVLKAAKYIEERDHAKIMEEE